MARKRYRGKTSQVERDAVKSSKGPRRATPGRDATKEERREHSRRMESASKVKATDTRETRQEMYRQRDTFQGINSGKAAQRQKGTGTIMLAAMKRHAENEFVPFGYRVRSTVIDTEDHARYMLAVKPAEKEFVRDEGGKIQRNAAGNPMATVVTPADYKLLIVADTGDTQEIPLGSAKEFRDKVVLSALEDGKLASDGLVVDRHLAYLWDVLSYGEHEAAQRARIRSLRNDVRESELQVDVVKAQAKAKAIATGETHLLGDASATIEIDTD